MSENDRQALADAFDREIDPLADHASTFDHVDVDVFGLFIEDVLRPKDPAESTIVSYERTIEEWSEFMQGKVATLPVPMRTT